MHTTATRFLLLITPLRLKLLTPPSLHLLTRHHLHLTRRPLHSLQRAATIPNNNSDPSFSTPETHRFPAWSSFVNSLSAKNYFSQWTENEFIASDCCNLPDEFVRCVNACLAFARHRPSILRLLPRRDVEVVVENVRPVLFRDGEDSVRRLRGFLSNGQSSGIRADKAEMIDLMRLLLSYMSNPVVSVENPSNSGYLEESIQNLLIELEKQCHIASNPELIGSVHNQFPDRHARSPRQFGQNIEMKRGDWICQRCSFMNFARNTKCLECEEARPRRHLTGKEWECPQCGFFNFGTNMACIRCDCKQPGDGSLSSTNLMAGLGYRNGSTADKTDLDRKLAANEEKAQRWFSKISQLDSTSDMSSAIADEDFPDIMPLRKGVNRFVVSTRKTPLDRRMANAKYRRSLGNNGSPEVDVPTGGVNKTNEAKISQTLEEILGRVPRDAARTNNIPSSSSSHQHNGGISSTSNFISSAPVSSEMTAKCNDSNEELEGESNCLIHGSTEAGILGDTHTENLVSREDNNNMNREYDGKREGWSDDIEERSGVKNMPSNRSDHVIGTMQIHERENRSIFGKQKDLPSASPVYKRHNTVEQTYNSSFTPFVPFPPGYFAKKDKQPPDGTHSAGQAIDETSNSAVSKKPPENFDATAPAMSDRRNIQIENHQHPSTMVWNSGGGLNESNFAASYAKQSSGDRNSPQIGERPLGNVSERRNMWGNSHQPSENQNIRGSCTGKSLEGSAVKEPDPLDMSEEAKAERWFRRVAQIKDISELSQIPDEDFPSIMPMRKGVNRFVVSKRKTPLERRLTSSQYRKNLPIMSSDSLKAECENKERENK